MFVFQIKPAPIYDEGKNMRGCWKILRGVPLLLLVVFVLSFAGCATTDLPKPKNTENIFYPKEPELPRLQYLVSFTSAKDIEPPASAFDAFVTGEKEAVKRLDKPYGVSMYDGKIYVCDTNNSVFIFDLKAKKLSRLEGAKGIGKLIQPLNISIDSDGAKYVVDPIRGQVVMYDRNDFYVKTYGMPGSWKPTDSAPFGDRLYVVDARNREIKVFNKKNGVLVKKIGQRGVLEERLNLPTNLTIDKNGTIFVSDPGRDQIVKYDRDGHYLGKIGNPGQNPGFFSRSRGLAVDKKGRVYAVDAAFDNVQIFMPNGQLLMFFGKAGTTPGDLFLPAKVYIDYDNVNYFREYIDPSFDAEYLVIVTSQFGTSLVNVYAFGREKGKTYPSIEEIRKEALEKAKKWQEEHPEEVEQGKENKNNK